jgi:hypothetical protein
LAVSWTLLFFFNVHRRLVFACSTVWLGRLANSSTSEQQRTEGGASDEESIQTEGDGVVDRPNRIARGHSHPSFEQFVEAKTRQLEVHFASSMTNLQTLCIVPIRIHTHIHKTHTHTHTY